MRRTAFVLWLSLLALPATASAPVDAFTLKFSTLRNGDALGGTIMQFKPARAGVWQFSSTVNGTEGLAGLAGAGVNETSTLTAPGGQLTLFSNALETRLAWKTSVKTTALLKGGKAYQYSDGKTVRMADYAPQTLDRHSLTVALVSDLRAGLGPEFSYRALAKGRAETYRFRVTGEERLNTALGMLDTVRVERIRESSDGKRTRIWFAKSRGYLPVLIQELDRDGDDIEMRIAAIR